MNRSKAIRSLLCQRRGEGDTVAYKMFVFIIFAFIIGFAVIFFLGIMGTFDAYFAKVPPNLERSLLMDRLTLSKDCLAYQDPLTGRILPGVIDATGPASRSLACYNTDNGPAPYAFRVTVYAADASRGFSHLSRLSQLSDVSGAGASGVAASGAGTDARPLIGPLQTANWVDGHEPEQTVTKQLLAMVPGMPNTDDPHVSVLVWSLVTIDVQEVQQP